MLDRNKYSCIRTISLPEELGGEIECEILYHIENDGIGHYEYWGAHCYDRGIDYIEIDNIIPVFTEENNKQSEILQWIDENFEEVNDNLCEGITIDFGDYEDRNEI